MVLDFSIQTVWVTPERLRQVFNNGKYLQRLERGEFRKVIIKEYYPNPIKSGLPRGTKTQVIAYVNSADQQVALVHQYRNPDGSLGGSGLPDPKQLLEDGILYLIDYGDF